MATNLTTTIIKAETLSDSIAILSNETLAKYIKRALNIVGSYIDLKQFNDDEGDTTFPDDMIQAITYIIEYIYIDNGMFGQGPNNLKSERIGDYSYTKGSDRTLSSIDLPYNIQAMLDNYRTLGGNIETDIGGYDRDYSDAGVLDVNNQIGDIY